MNPSCSGEEHPLSKNIYLCICAIAIYIYTQVFLYIYLYMSLFLYINHLCKYKSPLYICRFNIREFNQLQNKSI